ncbi:MAG: hypothetical protein ACYDCL_03505 [Myxococcales bacterium]
MPARSAVGAAAIALAFAAAGTAPARIYHPEFIRPHHGLGLIDCGRGFEVALREYFVAFGKQDGLPVTGAPELTVTTPNAPISRFTARLPGETYRGFVFVDPTLTEGDSEPWEDDGDGVWDKVCSAVFVDGQASVDEKRQIELGWNEVVSRLYLDSKAHVGFVGAKPPPTVSAAAKAPASAARR